MKCSTAYQTLIEQYIDQLSAATVEVSDIRDLSLVCDKSRRNQIILCIKKLLSRRRAGIRVYDIHNDGWPLAVFRYIIALPNQLENIRNNINIFDRSHIPFITRNNNIS